MEVEKKIDEGGQAFPSDQKRDYEVSTLVRFGGLTKRDYFAAHASSETVHHVVQEYLRVLETNEPDEWGKNGLRYSEYHCRQIATIEARYRYALADAMIAASKNN